MLHVTKQPYRICDAVSKAPYLLFDCGHFGVWILPLCVRDVRQNSACPLNMYTVRSNMHACIHRILRAYCIASVGL